MKKHWKFVNWTFSEQYMPEKDNNNKFLSVFSVILFVFLMIFSSFLRIKMSLWMYLFFYMMCFNCISYKNGFGRFERSLPVKDSFVVNSMLFAVPITYVLFVMATLGVFLVIIYAAVSTVLFDSSFFKEFVDIAEEMIRSTDVLCIIFSIGIIAGIWFLMALQIFYKKVSRRIAGQCGVIAVICIIAVCLSDVMKKAGVTGEYSFSEFIYVFPTVPAVVGAVLFAFVSGVYSWNRAVYLYRHDVAGQAKLRLGKGDVYDKSKMVLFSEDGKKARLFAGVVALTIWVLVMAFLLHNVGDSFGGEVIDSGSGEIHVTSSSQEEYGDWDSYIEREGVPETAAGFVSDGMKQIIFPSEINEVYIKEYYARIDGDYSYKVYDSDDYDEPESSGSYSLEYARFMVADYPKDEFEKECDRLANLTYKYDYGDEEDEDVVENHVLVNDDSFPAKTYIAVYNSSYVDYEYAIADEDTGRIIYVFLDDCTSVPTDIEYKAEKSSTVIPLTKRNYGKGYSIYQ